MADLSSWLRLATARLAASSDTPRLDAELLAAHALGIERGDLLLRLRELDLPDSLDALLARRVAGEPVAYLTGWRDFWTLRLKVSADVLIPRPDSETLIEVARDHFSDRPPPARILDLGTGSGALLLAALSEWPDATGLGTDRSAAALRVATENAQLCGLKSRAAFRQCDWAEGVAERFALVLCNPPYVALGDPLAAAAAAQEPHDALFGGVDGLDAYRALAPMVACLLAPGGLALFEIGHDQGESAAEIFAAAGWSPEVRPDLSGRTRCLSIFNDLAEN